MKAIDLLYTIRSPFHEAEAEAPYEPSLEQLEHIANAVRAKLFFQLPQSSPLYQWSQILKPKLTQSKYDASTDTYTFTSDIIPAILTKSSSKVAILSFGSSDRPISQLHSVSSGRVKRGRFYKDDLYFVLSAGKLILGNVPSELVDIDPLTNCGKLIECYQLDAVFDSPHDVYVYNLKGNLDTDVFQRRYEYPMPAVLVQDLIQSVRASELSIRQITEQQLEPQLDGTQRSN